MIPVAPRHSDDARCIAMQFTPATEAVFQLSMPASSSSALKVDHVTCRQCRRCDLRCVTTRQPWKSPGKRGERCYLPPDNGRHRRQRPSG
eukprot:3844662-Rhodomonas_salina.1